MTIHDLVFSQSVFSPRLAVMLKSTTAAIALASLATSTKPRDIPLLPREREDALTRLRQLSLLASETEQRVDLNAAAVAALVGSSPSSKAPKADKVPPPPPPATFTQILNGAFDQLPAARLAAPTEEMLQPIVEAWGKLWGRGAVKLTSARRRHFVRFVRDGGKPSNWCRAILGMKHDDWGDRAKHCDWEHVLKAQDRWVTLFNTLGMPKKTTEEDGALLRNVTTHKVDGVNHVVPIGYAWNEQDVHMAKQGYVFDLTTSKWRKPEKKTDA